MNTQPRLKLVRTTLDEFQKKQLYVYSKEDSESIHVFLLGSLISDNVESFNKHLPLIINKSVEVDFEKLEFIDGSGLMAFSVFFGHVIQSGHKINVIHLKGQPLSLFKYLDIYEICCHQRRRKDKRRYKVIPKLKRFLDIVLSCLVIGICFIPSLILCALIRLESPGSPIYTQTRLKRHTRSSYLDQPVPDENDTFKMYKFRTMFDGAEKNSGAVNASKDDPRVTRIGRFLRKTRLDEIPNFINVLKGEMSVSGPRADRLEILRQVKDLFPSVHERSRFIKPGITGPAQIALKSNGDLPSSNFELLKHIPENEIDKETQSFRYKLYYEAGFVIQSFSLKKWFLSEIKTLMKTLLVMFFKKNVI